MNFSFLLVALTIVAVYGQRTDDCGKISGCFLDPPNCVNDACDHLIKWRNRTSDLLDMEVTVRVTLPVNIQSAWVGLAFADQQEMGNNSAVLCFSNLATPNNVQGYYLIGHNVPIVFLASNPTYGITNPSVTANNGFLSCRFTRQKSSSDYSLFADISKNTYYILNAYGIIDNQGGLVKHNYTATLSDTKVDFNSKNVYGSPESKNSDRVPIAVKSKSEPFVELTSEKSKFYLWFDKVKVYVKKIFNKNSN
jgi:hypothetical protein